MLGCHVGHPLFSHSNLPYSPLNVPGSSVQACAPLLGSSRLAGPVNKALFLSVPGALGTPPEVWFAEHQGCKVGAHRPHPLTAPLASGKPGVAGAQVQRAHCSCFPAPGSPYLSLYLPSGCLYIFLRVSYFLPACPYRLSLHLPAGSLLSARVCSTLPYCFPPLLPSYSSLGWLFGFSRLPYIYVWQSCFRRFSCRILVNNDSSSFLVPFIALVSRFLYGALYIFTEDNNLINLSL